MRIGAQGKVVLGFIGSIILGAFGSGLWEVAIKPGGSWCGHAILTAATFGSKYLRDQIYVEAAKGYHEAASNLAAYVLILLCAAGVGYLIATSFEVLKFLRKKEDEGEEGTAKKHSKRTLWSLGIAYFLCVAVLMGIFISLMAMEIKTKAANDLATYFQQSLTICGPYLNDQQKAMLKSRYAAMRSEKEYKGITNELMRTAESNHVRLPDLPSFLKSDRD